MALIRCPECGQMISEQAPACIHCGYPIQKALNSNTVYIKLPTNEGVIKKIKYRIQDSDGKILAEGQSGDILAFKLDYPTVLTCSVISNIGSAFKDGSIEYEPDEITQYVIKAVDKFTRAYLEFDEVAFSIPDNVGVKSSQSSIMDIPPNDMNSGVNVQPDYKRITPENNDRGNHNSGNGFVVFIAVLLAIIAAVYLIPRLFTFEFTLTPIK